MTVCNEHFLVECYARPMQHWTHLRSSTGVCTVSIPPIFEELSIPFEGGDGSDLTAEALSVYPARNGNSQQGIFNCVYKMARYASD